MSENTLSKVLNFAKNSSKSMLTYNSRKGNVSNKNIEIMDPVSTVIRLSILNYLPDGTKISFSDNHIKYHEPWVLQGIVRWMNGSGRTDLHNLYYPLKKFRQWSEKSFGKDADLDLLKIKCSEGLLRLRKGYSESDRSICHSIDLYNQMLLNGDELIKVDNENKNPASSSIYKQIQTFWSEMEINIICNLIREIEATNNELMKKYYIKSIENVLTIKDHKIGELILETLNGE